MILSFGMGAMELMAQCPMCKAAVENNERGTSFLGEALNSGILYILALPYLMLMGIGFLYYRKWKQKKAAEAAEAAA